MIRVALALAVGWSYAAASLFAAQESEARRHVERGLAAASAGDTAAALYELAAATRADPKLADAHYHIGRLYVARASAVESDFDDRLAAERALHRALSLDPSNPLYLLELGRLKLKQQIRVDALRLLSRALDQAKRRDDPRLLAEVHHQIGSIYEAWYESLAHKRLTPTLKGPPAAESWGQPSQNVVEYVNDYLDEAQKVEDSGWVERDLMVEHYRAALRFDPGNLQVAIRLLGLFYDESRFTEYLALIEPLVQVVPESAAAHLFLGLGYHALGREDEAGAAFRRALELLPTDDRRAIESLAPVLRRTVAELYEGLSDEARTGFETRFWSIADPLYLTEVNERWLEHVSRAAYADLRFSAPELGLRGWETDRGVIYIRYGRPQRIGVFAPEWNMGNPLAAVTRTIVWSYGRKSPTFLFRQQPGYRHATFAGDFEFWADEYRHAQPASYRIPSLPVLYTIPVQVARFRGERPDEALVEVHAGLPLDSLDAGMQLDTRELELGFFLLDTRGAQVERRVREIILPQESAGEIRGLRSWRLILPADSLYHLGVEVRDPLSWRSATARDTLTARRYAPGRVQISDILLADFLHPRVAEPTTRDELDLRANPRLGYDVGLPVHIYYEIYDLQPDSVGFGTYDVTLGVRVTSLERGGGFLQLLGVLADAWGFSIVGDDRVEVTFRREVNLGGRDRTIGWYSLDLQDAPPGEYEIRVEVADRNSGATATRVRAFRVTRPEPET